MGKTIAICNQKGGTGKTTTAINLSAYLGLVGKKTLLIDFDPQGNATSGVGFDFQSVLENEEGVLEQKKPSIYEILVDGVSPFQVIAQTDYENLFIIPSDISLTGAEIELVGVEGREKKLKQVLTLLKDKFDYIIVDAPPSLGLLTLNALTAVDSLIVPIQCEYYALEGISKLVNTMELVKENLNPNLDFQGILLTMADFRTRLTLQVIEEVKGYFKDKVFNTIIPRNVKLAEAPSFGKPIHIYEPICVGSKAYANLTEEITGEKVQIMAMAKA